MSYAQPDLVICNDRVCSTKQHRELQGEVYRDDPCRLQSMGVWRATGGFHGRKLRMAPFRFRLGHEESRRRAERRFLIPLDIKQG